MSNKSINPKALGYEMLESTGYPASKGMVNAPVCSPIKESVRKLLRVQDEQRAVTRYKWSGLPMALTSVEVERLLYYWGQLCLFYLKAEKKFYLMPFALEGGLDFYGRFNSVHPVPFASPDDIKKSTDLQKQRDYLASIKLKVLYDFPEVITPEVFDNSCVIIRDYTPQRATNHCIPRAELQDPVLSITAKTVPYMLTALQNSTGVTGIRCGQNDNSTVIDANQALKSAAENGEGYVALASEMQMEALKGGAVANAEQFLEVYQALDNLSLSFYGLQNGGVYQKKAQMLQAEQEMNSTNNEAAYIDGLYNRQSAIMIANFVWGIGMWCDDPVLQAMGGDLEQTVNDSPLGEDNNSDDKNDKEMSSDVV